MGVHWRRLLEEDRVEAARGEGFEWGRNSVFADEWRRDRDALQPPTPATTQLKPLRPDAGTADSEPQRYPMLGRDLRQGVQYVVPLMRA
ncbi:hypothetical protein DL764_001803 [Monosporascus ibericus]|uniref:Uncharacterized protein n=1 Tax=Monosporascus ibericus TaxID=155417 RepID=A0A4Q4TPF8_9PEZI|nr:hypothetical protein DL764_001803 [Monosporascus ibericus]